MAPRRQARYSALPQLLTLQLDLFATNKVPKRFAAVLQVVCIRLYIHLTTEQSRSSGLRYRNKYLGALEVRK